MDHGNTMKHYDDMAALHFVADCIQLGRGDRQVTARKTEIERGSDDSVVVSFRAPRALVEELDEIASGSQRTRANFIVRTLTQAVSLEPAIATMEQILPRLVELHQKAPDSAQAEFYRGVMSGARWMLAAFFGKRAIRWANEQVRKRTGLPMPHVVPLAEDGNRYGFDSEADI